jgi:hypothetical protein
MGQEVPRRGKVANSHSAGTETPEALLTGPENPEDIRPQGTLQSSEAGRGHPSSVQYTIPGLTGTTC